VKRLCADDSADSRVKVGHRQANTVAKAQQKCWAFCFLPLHARAVGCGVCSNLVAVMPLENSRRIIAQELDR